jgi:para-nitrobenzyl esterase
MRARVAVTLCAFAFVAGCTGAGTPATAPPLGELVAVEQGELLGAVDGSVLRYRSSALWGLH